MGYSLKSPNADSRWDFLIWYQISSLEASRGASELADLDMYHQGGQAMKMVNIRIDRLIKDAQVRAPIKQDWQSDSHVETGQRSADAEMQTPTETGVGNDLVHQLIPSWHFCWVHHHNFWHFI